MIALRWPLAAIACLPLAATIVRLTGWWPCETACQGGGRYQTILGLSVLWPALVVYGLLAGSMLRDAWRGGAWRDDDRRVWSRATCALAGLAAGGALFYLYVAWSLSLVCTYCLGVHLVSVVLLFAVASDAVGTALLALLLGALTLNAVFHHRVEADVVEQPATQGMPPPVTGIVGPTTAAGSTTGANPVTLRADANRTRGTADAPLTVEYGYSLQCSHCAEQHGPLLATLAPAVADGRIRLVLRPVVRPSDPGSRWLALWSFAAALQSPEDLDRYLIERLDTRADLSRGDLLKLGGELPLLDTIAGKNDFGPLVDGDQKTLAGFGYRGATPFVVVHRGAAVVGKFARDVPLDQLTMALTPAK